MKKKKLKNLKLNKETVSVFNVNDVKGGRAGATMLDSMCTVPFCCPDPSVACSEITVCHSINYCPSEEFANA